MGWLARLGNVVGAAGIAVVLLVAFGLQFGLKELPCPLCNLQRVAFVLCGMGFVLNLRFGAHPLHYGLSLFAALFGVAVAGRQVLLHIVPGTGAYGSTLFDVHLSTWSLLAFVAGVPAGALL